MTKNLQILWNKIPKSICCHLVDSFDKKIRLIKEKGKRANKRIHNFQTWNFIWKNKWNSNNNIERMVYNEEILNIGYYEKKDQKNESRIKLIVFIRWKRNNRQLSRKIK